MNIGITIHLQTLNESLYSNGIKQNAIFLLNVFKQLGHNAYIVNESEIKAPYEGKVAWDTNKIEIKDWLACEKETDILFLVGATFSDKEIKHFKSLGPNKKVIKYSCGNNYIMDMEAVMFNIEGRYQNYNQAVDECWLIPQHEKTCKEYFRMMHNLPSDKVKVVPFVWDPMFIDQLSEKFKTIPDTSNVTNEHVPVYVPGKKNSDKQVASFEPNLNIVKWSMIPLLIVDDYIKIGGEVKKLNIFSGTGIIKNKYYLNLIKNTKAFNNKPIQLTYYPRTNILAALAAGADIVIAHQWENVLNYSYLDALYLGFPLVHNSPYLKDAGYYYQDFNVSKGRNQLKIAIEQHDNIIEDYVEKAEDAITRYTVYNEEMVELYGKLLENITTPGKHKLSYQYNWKTNTYL